MTNNSDSWNQQPSNNNDGWNEPSSDQSSNSGWGQEPAQTWGQEPAQTWGQQSSQGWGQSQPSANQSWEEQSNQAWGQQGQDYQSYDTTSSYGQPYHAQPNAYPPVSPYGSHEPESKGPGMTALIMALSALGISLVLSLICGRAYVKLFTELGPQMDTNSIPSHLEGTMVRAGITVLAQIIPTIIGIVALVLAGRAMGKPGSKALGVWGLITALLAPVISFIVFMAIVMPAVAG